MKSVMAEVLDERRRQDDKWGVRDQHPYLWMTILGEEYGEACQGALYIYGDDVNKGNAYRNELIQVAAVAIAAIESFDREGKGTPK